MTRGEQISEDVRGYLFTNGLKQSQLTGKLLAELADRCLARLDQIDRRKKKLATEEAWLAECEKDPALYGIDVRKALAECQFWCKNNNRICTRKMFSNWLLNPRCRAMSSKGGTTPQKTNGHAAPAGWLTTLNQLFPDCVYAKGGTFEIKTESDYEWGQVDRDVRTAITKAL